MAAPPQFAPGHDALVAVRDTGEPVPFVVDAVHGDRVTLAVRDASTSEITVGNVAHVQYVDRFGIYEFDATVLERDAAHVVLGVPPEGDEVRRRAYVRLQAPLDAACLLLDPDRNAFTELDASVVDVGGGGAALAVPAIAPTGATMVCSIAIAQGAPVVTVAHVLAPDADPRDQPERRHVR